MKINTHKALISLIYIAIIISWIAIPCQGKRYWNDYFIFSLKFKVETQTITSNVRKMDINIDEMLYINDNIAVSEYLHGLFIINNDLKKYSFIRSDGSFYNVDENGDVIFVESDAVVFISKNGIKIWSYPIQPECGVAPIIKMNHYYYIQQDCNNNDGTIDNWLGKYSEDGVVEWEKIFSNELSGIWNFGILGAGQDEIFLIGSSVNDNYYIFPVDENGSLKKSWKIESGYMELYLIIKDSNELLFFFEKDREYFLSKYQSGGELVFNVKWNGIRIDFDSFECKKILLDEDRNIYLFGSEATLPLRMIVTKYDEDGNELWTKVLIGDYYEDFINYEISDVQYRGSGEFYVIGSSDRYGWNKGVQTVIVGMDSDGNRQWIQSFHPENAQYLTPMATTLDEKGDLFVAGTYSVEEEVIDNVGGCGC